MPKFKFPNCYIVNKIRLICPRKLGVFFYACHFGVLFDQKTRFEKPGILVVVWKLIFSLIGRKSCYPLGFLFREVKDVVAWWILALKG